MTMTFGGRVCRLVCHGQVSLLVVSVLSGQASAQFGVLSTGAVAVDSSAATELMDIGLVTMGYVVPMITLALQLATRTRTTVVGLGKAAKYASEEMRRRLSVYSKSTTTMRTVSLTSRALHS